MSQMDFSEVSNATGVSGAKICFQVEIRLSNGIKLPGIQNAFLVSSGVVLLSRPSAHILSKSQMHKPRWRNRSQFKVSRVGQRPSC